MNVRAVSKVGIFVTAGIALLMFMLPQSDAHKSGLFGSVGNAIDALPPSGASMPASLAPAPAQASRPEAYLGGTVAIGRVSEVYVRVAENVFLAVDQAPEHLRNSAERWVDVQFPELLANNAGSARAVLNRSDAGIEVGDVVKIKFAHKDNPRYFPVKEVTRVTEFVARKNEMLAKDFERRILARNGHGASPPGWLAHAPTPASSPSPAPRTTTADTRP